MSDDEKTVKVPADVITAKIDALTAEMKSQQEKPSFFESPETIRWLIGGVLGGIVVIGVYLFNLGQQYQRFENRLESIERNTLKLLESKIDANKEDIAENKRDLQITRERDSAVLQSMKKEINSIGRDVAVIKAKFDKPK